MQLHLHRKCGFRSRSNNLKKLLLAQIPRLSKNFISFHSNIKVGEFYIFATSNSLALSQCWLYDFLSLLRNRWPYKNGWIFGKIPNICNICNIATFALYDPISHEMHVVQQFNMVLSLNWLKTYPKKTLLYHFHAEKALFKGPKSAI